MPLLRLALVLILVLMACAPVRTPSQRCTPNTGNLGISRWWWDRGRPGTIDLRLLQYRSEQPIPHLWVTVRMADPGDLRPAIQADRNGQVYIFGASPGVYVIGVEGDGYHPLTHRVTLQAGRSLYGELLPGPHVECTWATR